MKKSRIAIVLSLALLAGCAGQRTRLSEEHHKTLTTEPVHAVHSVATAGFMVQSTGYTTAGVLFSPLVVLAQAAEGASMISELGLEDPVVRVKERVLVALEGSYKIPNVIRVAQPVNRLASDTKSMSGLLFEVRTIKWGIDNNRVKYAAGVRVVRLADNVTLWDAVCNDAIVDKDKPSPTADALRADKGALLKAKLNQAADACADQLAGWAIERVERR